MAANIDSNLANWSTTDSSNQPDGTDSADIDAELRRLQAVVRKYTRNKGADIASASTTDLSTATGDYVDITGTTTITSFGTVSVGMRFILQFDDTLTLTHSSALVLPGAANITTAAGDHAIFESLGSGNWVCVAYTRASGLPAKAGANSDITSLTALNEAAFKSAYNMEAGVDYLGYVAHGTANNVLTSTGSGWASSSLFALISMSTDPGYIKFQNGLLIQWGLKSDFGGASTQVLPYSYTNTNYGVYTSLSSSSVTNSQACYIRARNAGSIDFYNTATFAVHWLTIGQAA